MTTRFENIRNNAIKTNSDNLNKFLEELQEITNKESLNHWRYLNKLTPTRKKQFNDLPLEELKLIIAKKARKDSEKEIKQTLEKIELAENAPDMEDCTLSIEWKKSATWGNNPTCEAKIKTKEHGYKYYSSGSISGCGYCKESTATAKTMNQSSEILKLFYQVYNDNMDKTPEQLFGYDISLSCCGLPYFSGGVGVNCHQNNFKLIGWNMNHLSSGKKYDVYYISEV